MIGVIIVAHGALADALVEAAEFILGRRIEAVRAIGVQSGEDPEHLNSALTKGLAELNDGDGVLILTDMFGGSPSDMSLSFLDPGRVEVLTGVNLPMFLNAVTRRNKAAGLKELAEEAERKGIEAITMAGKLLGS